MHEALKDINLQVDDKDIYGIIGLSGAGKSTLIRCLTQLEKPTSGKILIDNIDFTGLTNQELRQHKKKIGMIFQHFNLLSSRTVAENVAYPLEISHTPKPKQYSRVQELLKLVNLSDKGHMYPSELSGGEKQRVGIARALALSPSLLLCDEATSALDPKSTHQILDLLKSLNTKLGLTILLITHEMDVIKTICNKVAVLHKGSIVEQGSVIDVFANPKHSITKSFLEQRSHVLPQALYHANNPSKRLLKLYFKGENAGKPIISKLIKNHPVDVNILLGSLDCLQNTIIGTLTIEISGKKEDIETSLSFLNDNHVAFEEVHL
ncbi:MAG: ATP-binding cassette domain-containing protein [Chlamydiales bacterium]|nr:ATP-binding cassette domain-containing protein [Chlamydiales bacterium]